MCISRLVHLSVVVLLASSLVAERTGNEYPYKTVKDFKTLEHSRSVGAFEAAYRKYEQDCLDHTLGGTAGIPCETLRGDLWDRELNIYYERLLKALDDQQKTLLQDSQRQWIEVRDSTIKLNSALLHRRYDMPGTMYSLMRSGDASSIITPMVKQRALTLKAMWELASKQPLSKEGDQ
jgi:uncharacterized protein YecT (DUF1311 family)